MSTGERFLSVDAGPNLRAAAGTIIGTFDWGASSEGDSFWRKVYQLLCDKANQADMIFGSSGAPLVMDQKVSVSMIQIEGDQPIHITKHGTALCTTVKGKPWEWPAGHTHVTLADADKATCRDCLTSSLNKAP